MAKVSFTKLGLKTDNTTKQIQIGEQVVEVKQYLPVNDKLELISAVLNYADDEKGFYNEGKLNVYTWLLMVDYYTNISFTDKQREEVNKTYDALESSGVLGQILEAIPVEEYNFITRVLHSMADSITKYRNSVMGILESISTDYSNLNLDATNITENLSNPDNLNLVRDILSKLG